MIKIAVSKGRVAKEAIRQLREVGYCFPEIPERQLWAVDNKNEVQLLFVKAQDVPSCVDGGYVDLGVVGRDILLEAETSSFEVLDICASRCRMCLAGPKGKKRGNEKFLRLASKYPRITKRYLEQIEKNGVITSLQGSLELAPVMGISDYIVDLVESGKTLEAHGLVVYKELFQVSSVLIADRKTSEERKESIKPFVTSWCNWIKNHLEKKDWEERGFENI